MPLEAIAAPRNATTTGRWTIEIAGVPLVSFSQVDGMFNRSIGTVSRVDGGTGITYRFANQIVTYSSDRIQLTRQVDPDDPNDALIEQFMTDAIRFGRKLDGELTKYHFDKPFWRFRIIGLLFVSESHPTLQKGSGTIYTVTYGATLDFWERLNV
jgi:hypothetical protein